MMQTSQSHKAAVLMAMRLIRPVFQQHGYNLERYSNNAVADALLEECPEMDASWLGPKHLRRAVRHLKRRHGAGSFFLALLKALGLSHRNGNSRPSSN
jgi:hypothetical protein